MGVERDERDRKGERQREKDREKERDREEIPCAHYSLGPVTGVGRQRGVVRERGREGRNERKETKDQITVSDG